MTSANGRGFQAGKGNAKAAITEPAVCPVTPRPSTCAADTQALRSDWNTLLNPPGGKQSAVAEYCERVVKNGVREKCVFICRRKGRRTFAEDIWPKDTENPIIRLQDQEPWWSRWSLYRIVSVRHVKVGIMFPQMTLRSV